MRLSMIYSEAFEAMMRAEGLSEDVVHTFVNYYVKYVNGERGKLGRDMISPPEESKVENYGNLTNIDSSLFSKLVICKLNGGLGTSMGLTKAKSLLPVFLSDNNEEITFLDIILKQIIRLKENNKVNPIFMLMNSYNTNDDTLDAISKYNFLKEQSIAYHFIQNKYPRIRKSDNKPLDSEDKNQNWNPPGHGDIYTALSGSGLLDELLDNGIEYMFVSNSDNLGATADIKILTWMAETKIPFVMEVCQRTEMDKKGGHLAQDNTGQLLLREVAQCPDDEIEQFQNIKLYSYFNTNSLWINLIVLKEILISKENTMDLPLIVNPKVVDGEEVIQLETAMGAAISVFRGSKAIEVPRSRFIPVKKTDDLLLLWLGIYKADSEDNIVLNRAFKVKPNISLDSEYFKTVDDLYERIGKTKPNLEHCTGLRIQGNVFIGENVSMVGDVDVIGTDHPYTINNRVLEGYTLCHPSRI
ncbi:MAG: UTP--glucose-1-phosphate uridylyltransferase [Candidatus Cloacimonetes bacterium]|nr:UTP--glucose-1-phosphate uridylyltransferase [Candidatus Cloacimonadota bacterium]